MKTLISLKWVERVRRLSFGGAGLLAFLSLAASVGFAQPANDSFANAAALTGDFGSVVSSNNNATAEANEPSHAGFPPIATIWYKWTANLDGLVEFDTFGSGIDTVLAVYTGSSLSTLNFVVANDNINPLDFPQRSSGVKFNATQGTTYYVAVGGKGPAGVIALNWAYYDHASGVFRFSADSYSFSETESPSNLPGASVGWSALGARIIATRLFGASGRVRLTFDTIDGTATNGTAAVNGTDYRRPPQRTLVFDHFEMSKSFIIPLIDDGVLLSGNPARFGIARFNRTFNVILSSVALDPLEDPAVLAPPRIDTAHSNTVVTILDFDAVPGTDQPPPTTNSYPGIVNFQRTVFRTSEWITNVPSVGTNGISIAVYRVGGDPNASAEIHYVIDSTTAPGSNTRYNTFALQTGSDYAQPDPNDGPDAWNPDFQLPYALGDYGTLNWGANDFTAKSIRIPIYNDSLPEFNEDLVIEFFGIGGHNQDMGFGNIGSQATVTILYDDYPAGALDENHNPDFIIATDPPRNTKPGTDDTVFALAIQSDDKTVVGGHFTSYNAEPRNGIARMNVDGSLDRSFDPGGGVSVRAGYFISSLAPAPGGKIVAGGSFNSFDGSPRYNIAQLNGDGSLDTFFNPGLGANGTVWAIAVQPDGKVLIGGEFITVDGINRAHIARLDTTGVVDPTFDPGPNAPNGTVYAIGLTPNGTVVIGGDFTALGGNDRKSVARLNADGTLDVGFVPGTGVDGPVYALGIQTDGKTVIGGSFSTVDQRSRRNIARLNANGSLDTTFEVGRGADDTVYTISLLGNGRIYLGGLFNSVNGTHRVNAARLLPTGEVDTSWLDTAYNQFAGPFKPIYNPNVNPKTSLLAMGVQSDGNVMIGGSFGYVGGGRVTPEVRTNSASIDPISGGPVIYYLSGLYAFNATGASRASYRVRYNVARLLGGITEGPGSLGFVADSYPVIENMSFLYVKIARTNGALGQIEATFSIPPRTNGPGVAQSGVDYIYNRVNPFYSYTWATTRSLSDGIWGTNNVSTGIFYPGLLVLSPLDDIYVTILNRSGIQGDRTAPFQLDVPSCADVFYLAGENIPLASALGPRSTTTLGIVEDDILPGVIGFLSPTYSVNENGTNALITLSRTKGSTGPVSVRFATTNGTAIAGKDYLGVTNTVTFRDGQTITNVSIPIIDDSIIQSADRTVLLYLSLPGGSGASLGLSNAVLSIVDNDFLPGRINLTSTSYSTNEDAGAVVVTVVRAGGNRGVLSVQYATSDLSARNGVDYLGVTNTLHWDDGDASPRTVVIPLIHDGLVGPPGGRNFNFVLSNPSVPGALGSRYVATITVFDTDFYGNLQFSAPAYYVNENGGYTTITVTRTGGSAESLTVNFATAPAGAVSSGLQPNFVATNGTLTFVQGETSKSFNVRILDDGVPDPPLSSFFFTVALSGMTPAAATLGYPTNAAVYIYDAQAYTQPPGSVDTIFDTSAGMNGDVLALALQSDGKLVAGGDFSRANSLLNNRIVRLNPFDGSLDNSFLASGLGPNAAIRTILNQTDQRLVVGGVFTVFNGVNRNHLVRLNYDGTLDTGFDPGPGTDNPVFALAETFVGGPRKLLLGGGFTLVHGFNRQGIARLNDDGSVDTDFDPGIGVQGTVYAIAAYSTNTVNAGKVLVGGIFTGVNGITRINLARLNMDGSLDTTFDPGSGANDTVRAITLQPDGKILIGGSFTTVNGVALNHVARLNPDGSVDTSFQVGEGANDTVYAITLQPDQRILLGGEFTRCSGVTRGHIARLMSDGTLDPTINFGAGANSFVAAVAVQPDTKIVLGGGFTQFDGVPRNRLVRLYGGSMAGSGRFEFTAGGYGVNEDGTNVLVTVRRTGGASGPNPDGSGAVSVTFRTSDGTAVAGVNYSNVTATLTFPMGEFFQTVAVPVIDDHQIAPDLFFNLALSDPTSPASLGDQPTAVVTVRNVTSAVSFSAATYLRAENAIDGVATFHVLRQGATHGLASVDFATIGGGTAVPGVNYLPVTNTITFADGELDKIVKVPVLHNPVAEGDKTVIVQLSNPLRALLLNPSQAVLTIVDVDRAPGQLGFSAPAYVVSEGDGSAIITVVRTNGWSGVVSVAFNTVPGTATPGLKYVSTNGVLTFADGEMSKTFTVSILEENQVEGAQALSLVLSDPTGGASIAGSPSVPLTILDDDVGVGFASPAYVVSETDASITLTVLRNGTNGVTRVDYATTNITASAGTNYTATSGTLVFNPGEALKTVTVPLRRDPRVTGDLSFKVYLFNPTGGAQLFEPSGALVILLDADTGLSLTTNAVSILENATNVVLTVVRSNANTGLVTVNYTTADGTALSGKDYGATSGTLAFTNGETVKTITIPIIDNKQVQPDRKFSLSLFYPTGGAQILPPDTATITIIDNDAGLSFSSASYAVNKGGVLATITVVRANYLNSTVSVGYATEDGTAKAFTNYVPVGGVLTFTNGETTKTFTVRVIDSTVIEGDKTVLLKLFNAVGNVALIDPSAATLTIREDKGGLVVAAGSALISESFTPTNGVIDPGETVTLLFAFRNSGGIDTSNLVATLLPTNGVTPLTNQQSYGVLTVGGPSKSQPFSFVANGANGSHIGATFKLQDGTNNLGQVLFAYTIGTSTTTFTNTAKITIRDYTNAAPYPSLIAVSGVDGLVTKITATLNGVSHTSPADIDALLVSPGGQGLPLLANAGAGNAINNVTLTFDDAASGNLPQFGQIVAGTYKPTGYYPIAAFPVPAPPAPYASSLDAFKGANPNGNWALYVIDDSPLDYGEISQGWRISMTTANAVGAASDVDLAMTVSPDTVIMTSNVTYSLTVTNHGPSAAAGVVVTDTLPPGIGYVSATASQGFYATNGTWTVGALAKDASATLTLVGITTVTGALTNSASVTAVTDDPNSDNNSARAVVTVVQAAADLTVGLADAPEPVIIGNNLTYTVTVTNLGPATATGVVVTNKLPAGVNFVSATSSQGVCSNAGSTVWCNLGDLVAGGQAVVTIITRPVLPGTVTDTVTATSAVIDPLKGNNSATVKTVVIGAELTIASAERNVVISWPDAFNGVLESANSLTPPVTWSAVTNPPPVNLSGQKTVTIGVTNGNQFFRLKLLGP